MRALVVFVLLICALVLAYAVEPSNRNVMYCIILVGLAMVLIFTDYRV